jgi:hypothetical protein
LFYPLVGFLEEIISSNLALLYSVGFHYVSEGRTTETQKDIARELAADLLVVQMMALLSGGSA